MSTRIFYVFGVGIALTVPTVLAFKYAPRSFTMFQRADTRTPTEKLKDENRKQTEMLAKHRELFEAVAKGDLARTAELRDTLNIDFGRDGPRFQFSWHNGGGALFGCTLVLYYCPNGEADLPDDFFEQTYKRSDPMKIDDHWFTAAENCG